MFGTFLASEIRLVRRILDDRGIPADPILKAARIDPALADRPRARYPSDRVAHAWALAAEATGEPSLGLDAARYYRPTDFHGLAVVFLASADLRTALGRLARFHTVVNTAVRMRLDSKPDRVELRCTTMSDSDERRRVIQDGRTAVIVDICRTAVAGSLDPLEVRFSYSRPADVSRHEAMFHCRVAFGADEWCLAFRAEDASRPFLASNRELAQSNDRCLEEMIASLRSDDLVARVKRAIVDELPSGAPSEESVARVVSMSARSLQRRLSEEGTGFLDLLAAVRRDLADRYVRNRDLPLTEVGYRLGFSDLSAFSRAFKRWNGRSPAEARRESTAAS